MHGQRIRPAFGKQRDEIVGVGHHEMHVERKLRIFFDGAHDRRADSQIRDEMPIHDIHVQPIGVLLNALNFVAQAREICGKN